MASASEVDVCVVIPTWNKRDLLRTCLESLAAQSIRGSVLVVDNGSTDGTLAMVRSEYPWVDCIGFDRNLGFAAAVNRGIRESRASLVALLNNDTEADPGWLRAGWQAAQDNPDYSLFASRLLNYWRRDRIDSAGDCYGRTGLPYKRGAGFPVSEYLKQEPVLSATAGAAFVRRAVFEKVGLLDEDFYMYLEDVDFCLRAHVAGFRCLYVPTAVVFHMEAASDPDCTAPEQLNTTGSTRAYYSPTRVYWITRNRWRLMMTFQPVRNLPWLFVGWARSFLFHLLKAGYTWDFLKGIGAGVLSSGNALAKRRQLRRLPDASFPRLWQIMAKC